MRLLTVPDVASYEWLFELLVGRTSAATWAGAGELPASFERSEQFAVLPAGEGRSFVVSLAERSGTYSALTSFNALRSPRRQLERRVLAIALRSRLGGSLLGSRVDVGTASGESAQPGDALLSEYLRAFFGCRRAVLAFGGGSGPYRKPVLQVFDADGTPLGYVKVGWNPWTRDAVRREAAALGACASRESRLGVPALLGQAHWHGLDLLITAPLPAGVRRLGRGARLPDSGLLTEISELWPGESAELAASGWWIGLTERIEKGVADDAARTALAELACRIASARGEEIFQFGSWHGDLVPWNLARLGTRLFAWDWESSAPSVPLGFDALHFYFQVAFVGRRQRLAEAVALAVRQAEPVLDALGVPARSRRLLAILHLLELFVRHEEARASTGDPDGRFYPAVAGTLGSLVTAYLEPVGADVLGIAS